MIPAKLLSNLGKVPGISNALRWYAGKYEEGSVVTIPSGRAAGMRWRRYHRYVSGYWTGIYELPLQNAFAREINEGNVIYDIGANAGFFTILAGKLTGGAGRVYSFEPLPENIESVRQQITLNALKQCELVTEAVSDRCGKVPFTLTDNNSTAHMSVSDNEDAKTPNKVTVNSVTLDDFVLSHPAPDFIKLDVEGAETAVLAGAVSLLSSKQAPKFLIELHGEDKAQSVSATLSEHKYRICDLEGAPLTGGALGHQHILAYPAR